MKLRQAGLTMVELLIAMVLSSIVIYAGVSMFLASRGTASTTQAVGALADNGRVALSFISASVRSGGAMACNATNDLRGVITAGGLTRQISILTPGGSPLAMDYTSAFGGLEALNTAPGDMVALNALPIAADANGGDWTGGLDALLTGRVVQGSDILAVRESTPQDAPVYTTANYASGVGQTTLNVNSVGNLQAGQFAVISNCTVSTAFQIAAVNSVANTITTNGALDQFGGDLKWSYEYPSSITPVDMVIYYIGAGRDTDSALFAYHESTGLYEELVPDVENMQVLYGIAPSQPNQVTEYVPANLVPDFNQVVSVQVALLLASPPNQVAVPTPAAAPVYQLLGTSVTAPLDERMRKVFTTTIAVENASL